MRGRARAADTAHPRRLFLVTVSAVLFGATGCSPEPSQQRFDALQAAPPAESLPQPAEARIEAFCSDCHALPRPESFDRDRWHVEVRKGYEFYAKSGRTDLDPPPLQETLAYYRARAPEQVTFPQPEEAASPLPLTFEQEGVMLEPQPGIRAEIAHLRWAPASGEEPPVLLASDMRYGHVWAIDLKPGGSTPRILARLGNPGRMDVCDLEGDGGRDVLVADLGSYTPAEHRQGRIVLLKRQRAGRAYEPIELLSGLPRVADVRARDLDGDGRLELIVAAFGWRETGRLLLLRNVAPPGDAFRWDGEQIDDRSGAIDVRIHDFTGDGRPDLAALFSQEHESLDLYVNTGRGRFRRSLLWAAPDLTFGLTGMELIDLNRDGRTDILATNGDSFDNNYASPWHGVQWLENRGGLTFACHRLTEMPGAHRALTADFDGDGRLDVVVTSWLPPQVRPTALRASRPASIVLLRQTRPGEFVRHTLERGTPDYPALAVGDFDADGDPDFAVAAGPYTADSQAGSATPEGAHAAAVAVWWNRGALAQP